MHSLTGKKILFICPKFYNYHQIIISNLKSLGAEVFYFADLGEEYLTKFVSKNKFLKKEYLVIKQKFLFEKIIRTKYDFIFVVRGEIITEKFIKKIKSRNFNSKLILYEWDSISNFNYLNISYYFDKVFSFDKYDCNEYPHIKYLPLFFSNLTLEKRFCNKLDKDNIDLLFVGGWHSDRLEILSAIENIAIQNKWSYHFHLYVPLLFYLKYLLLNEFKYKSFIKFTKKSIKQVEKLISKSNVIIDINNINQKALTIRTFEALSMGKKIITTNKHIKEEPFYKDSYILIIDRESIFIDKEFIQRESNFYDMKEYSIKNWLKIIYDL